MWYTIRYGVVLRTGYLVVVGIISTHTYVLTPTIRQAPTAEGSVNRRSTQALEHSEHSDTADEAQAFQQTTHVDQQTQWEGGHSSTTGGSAIVLRRALRFHCRLGAALAAVARVTIESAVAVLPFRGC